MNNSNEPSHKQGKNNSGLKFVFILFAIAGVLSLLLYIVYMRSENELTKSFADMQKAGHSLTIEGCAQKNMEWYQSCTAMTQLCDQSIPKMMRVCLTNGNKESQCDKYGDEVFGYNFGAEECRPYYSEKPLKKACADTYQAIADYCKAVRKSR